VPVVEQGHHRHVVQRPLLGGLPELDGLVPLGETRLVEQLVDLVDLIAGEVLDADRRGVQQRVEVGAGIGRVGVQAEAEHRASPLRTACRNGRRSRPSRETAMSRASSMSAAMRSAIAVWVLPRL
jgi:hypothetical protein